MIRGIPLAATVTPLDGNNHAFQVSGTPASNLPEIANPTDVRLAVRSNGVSLNTEFAVSPRPRPMTSLRDDAPPTS